MSKFPYWKYSLDKPDVMFDHLKNQSINTTKDNDHNTILIRNYPDDYMYCDHISNHFTEHIRINCRFANNHTPYEAYLEVKDSSDFKKLNKYDQRETIYGMTKECNTFNDTYCLYIITELVGNGAIILYPSMGWGNRLLAALASNASVYHGFDPNKLLHPSYKKIIKMFSNSDNKIKCKSIPFEDAKIKNDYYDLALTSPPYFDIERYGTDDNQSIIKNPDYKNWISNFYIPYLKKMVDSVKVDGFIAIYIEDIVSNKIRYPLREFTMSFLESTNRVKYFSKIGLKVGSKVRYTIVWKKIK